MAVRTLAQRSRLGAPTSIEEGNKYPRGCCVSEVGCIVRSYLCWKEKEALFIRVWKPLPVKCFSKTSRERVKRIISTSCAFNG